MGGIFLLQFGCAQAESQQENLNVKDQTLAVPTSSNAPIFTEIDRLNAKLIGLDYNLGAREMKSKLREYGFKALHLVGSSRISGECAGVTEELTYTRSDNIDGKDVILFIETDFRAVMIDNECQHVLHNFTPIIVMERADAKHK